MLNFKIWFESNRQNTRVYHRTGSVEKVEKIFSQGFIAATSTYGGGLSGAFFNFDLKNWLSPNAASAYGMYLIEVNLDMNDIVTDGSVSQKYNLGKDSLQDQLVDTGLSQDKLNVIAQKHKYHSFRHILSVGQDDAPLYQDLGFHGMIFRGKGSAWVMVFENGLSQLTPIRWTKDGVNWQSSINTDKSPDRHVGNRSTPSAL